MKVTSPETPDKVKVLSVYKFQSPRQRGQFSLVPNLLPVLQKSKLLNFLLNISYFKFKQSLIAKQVFNSL